MLFNLVGVGLSVSGPDIPGIGNTVAAGAADLVAVSLVFCPKLVIA